MLIPNFNQQFRNKKESLAISNICVKSLGSLPHDPIKPRPNPVWVRLGNLVLGLGTQIGLETK